MRIIPKILNHYRTIITAIDTEGKNKALLIWVAQLLYWKGQNTGGTMEFFLLKLHKKGHKVKHYLTENRFRKIHDELNREFYRTLLEDKYVFDRFLYAEGYPLAPMIAIIENERVRLPGKNVMIMLSEFLKSDLSCFCKMLTSYGGKDIFKIDIRNSELFINNVPSNYPSLQKKLSHGIFVLQETIKQHSELDNINPNCLNTLRIITIDSGNDISVLGGFIRIGVGKNIVDNTAQGNLVCGINRDGTLFTEASDQLSDKKWITLHPDSGIRFKGLPIPFYNESLNLCIDLHKTFGYFFIIGWDIAITETGPVIIEGNPLHDLLWLQILYGPIKEKFLNCAAGYKKTYPDRK